MNYFIPVIKDSGSLFLQKLTSNSLEASNSMAPGSIDAILNICSVTTELE
jgi:hypothetical protein